MRHHHHRRTWTSALVLVFAALTFAAGFFWPRAPRIDTVLVPGPVRYVDAPAAPQPPAAAPLPPVPTPVALPTKPRGTGRTEHAETRGLNLGVYEILRQSTP